MIAALWHTLLVTLGVAAAWGIAAIAILALIHGGTTGHHPHPDLEDELQRLIDQQRAKGGA